MWLKIALPLFFLFGQHCLCEAHIETHTKNPRVLLISFDGFRWDYVELAHREGRKTPNFDSLIQNGVKAKWVKNVFATKTFPNHYTLVTGMYEESHGVVGNEMYDPVFNKTFKMNNFSQECDPKWWNNGTKGGGGEPIWVTNQKDEQSLERRWSGVMFWPGSSAKVHGVHPYHYMDYDASLPNKTRIDNIVKWFSAKEDPINLGLLYFSEPDGLGHSKGPESLQMIDMIVALDRLVGYLIEQLKAYSLFESINIIITSDHGMAQIKSSIKIDDTVNSSTYKVYGSSPIWNIMPSDGKNLAELFLYCY
ncbi:hypothetical protein NP493_3051g00000 [Ridgeia piscesae]|uniref:Ectonucleotide pyrophosphatase/phosphodiesterase family member 5 n=1 Tax=Ridgeia piscesae TaxID=27915 RepID=A0AAD9J8Z5_RIDPI|nr:hypothetical protein NP493_3051g00000 [Ridgeia piscesae]